MSLFILFSAIAVYTLGNIRTRTSQAMLAGAVVFGAFLTLRTEPRLVAFDLLAALTLLVGAATFGRGDSPWSFGPIRLLDDLIDFVASWLGLIVDVPEDIGARARVASEQSSTLLPSLIRVIRGLVIALPIVILFGVLLASADIVFASFFDFDASFFGIGLGHLALIILASSLAVATQRKSSRNSALGLKPLTRPSMGKSEAVIVLGSVNLLFIIFAASQLYALTDGAEELMADAGLSYSEYARQGFFQLLWVAGLTLLVIVIISLLRRNRAANDDGGNDHDNGDQLIKSLSYLSSGLTIGIVAVAIIRLMLYINDKGLTPLRFFSTVFSIWIAVAFVIVMIRVSGMKANHAWLTPVLISSGMAVLFALNLSNPESIIATHNLELQSVEDEGRYYGNAAVLGEDKLTGDGLQVLIEGANTLPSVLQVQLHQSVCKDHFNPHQNRGWMAYNFSEASAQATKTDYCS